MRIAILTQYYPPETGAPQNRLSDLARRLAGRGHRVEVLTALPNYPGTEILPEYVGKENTIEEIDGVRVARVGLYVPKKKTFNRRVANYLSFAWAARRQGPRLLSRSDILISESPPLLLCLAGRYLAKRLGAMLVTNVSDLWPRSVLELGMMSRGPLYWAAERLESWMYRGSDLITAQTQGIADDIKSRFPGKPVALFPNGVDLSAYSKSVDREAVRARFGWKAGTWVLGYTGVLGHAQALGQVLDAARRIQADGTDSVHFALFGDGPVKEHLEKRIRDESIDSVCVYPVQPHELIPEIQAAFDGGIVPLAAGKLFEGSRPSKMFEIMASGRPVVLCACGEAAESLHLAEGGPAGVVVAPEDPEALAVSIQALCSSPETAESMGRQGKKVVKHFFDREIIAKEMEKLLLDTLAGQAVG